MPRWWKKRHEADLMSNGPFTPDAVSNKESLYRCDTYHLPANGAMWTSDLSPLGLPFCVVKTAWSKTSLRQTHKSGA